MNSFNHYSFGAVGQWMMTRILGIDRDPDKAGFAHFTLHPVPDPTHQMTYARGWYNTEYGTIRAGWEIHDGSKVTYKVTIPQGCSATLIVDGKERVEVGEGTFETEIDIPVSDI